ncbi:hypothetical protein [Herbaspirillum seropedicae]|uniref:hypothetical protein n=1 Tax=Herbaspirillum seropedicae TaxID=964 RepID=UPI003FCD3DF1
MKRNPKISETVAAFLEEHPESGMADIQKHVLGLGMSTEQGVQSVMRNLVRDGVVRVNAYGTKRYRYSLANDCRTVRITHASAFQVPPELAGPVLAPMAWSMRHLLGAL